MSRGTKPISPHPGVTVTATTETLTIQARLMPSLRYINEFFGMRAAADLLLLDVFPNAKEVTESFGAFMATRHLGVQRPSLDVAAVCVGDGCTPRTAALVAFLSRWTCWSVDPRLKWEACPPEHVQRTPRGVHVTKVSRLGIVPTRVEEMPAWVTIPQSRVIMMNVHAHVDLGLAARAVRARMTSPSARLDVIAMPCCQEQMLAVRPDIAYQDIGVWSPQRELRIWLDVL